MIPRKCGIKIFWQSGRLVDPLCQKSICIQVVDTSITQMQQIISHANSSYITWLKVMVHIYVLYSHPPANDTLKLRNWLHQTWAQPFTTKTMWKSWINALLSLYQISECLNSISQRKTKITGVSLRGVTVFRLFAENSPFWKLHGIINAASIVSKVCTVVDMSLYYPLNFVL